MFLSSPSLSNIKKHIFNNEGLARRGLVCENSGNISSRIKTGKRLGSLKENLLFSKTQGKIGKVNKGLSQSIFLLEPSTHCSPGAIKLPHGEMRRREVKYFAHSHTVKNFNASQGQRLKWGIGVSDARGDGSTALGPNHPGPGGYQYGPAVPEAALLLQRDRAANKALGMAYLGAVNMFYQLSTVKYLMEGISPWSMSMPFS